MKKNKKVVVISKSLLAELVKISKSSIVEECGIFLGYNDDYKFEIGKGVKIMEGGAATVIGAGFTTHIALEAARKLEEGGIEVDVINMASIKPLDKELIIESAQKTGLVIQWRTTA